MSGRLNPLPATVAGKLRIREFAGDEAPQPAGQEITTADRAATTGVRRRGILDDFLARSALLVMIYAVVNVVYQQSYLNYLGFRVGLWPIATALPLLTDFLIAFYASMIWLFLARFPNRWFDTVAELFNLGTWRDRETWLFRGLSLFLAYLVFRFTSSLISSAGVSHLRLSARCCFPRRSSSVSYRPLWFSGSSASPFYLGSGIIGTFAAWASARQRRPVVGMPGSS